jgi:hypothetical protein
MNDFEQWLETQYCIDGPFYRGNNHEKERIAFIAGKAAEREVCIRLADRNNIYPFDVADAIRKRGE